MTRLRHGALLTAVMMIAGLPARAEGQAHTWMADITAGSIVFVDEVPDHLFAIGGTIRRLVTPKVSIGPELVGMFGPGKGDAPDWVIQVTGNVMFDVYSLQGPTGRRVTPFVVGGIGMFWKRSRFLADPSLAIEPTFTAGGGIRARITERVSAAAEYRLGGDVYQRFTGTVTVALR